MYFRCRSVQIISSLKIKGVIYNLQPSLLKQEMEHDETFEDMWGARKDEWLPYVINAVLSTAFCFARYTKKLEELTTISMKNSVTLFFLANKYFISLRDENDEPIYTYTDPFMRNLLRKSVKIGRCNAFNQPYKSEFSDKVCNFISKELNVSGNIFDLLEKNFEFLNKYENLNAKEFDSKDEGYRDFIEKDRTDYINKKLNMLPIQRELSKLDIKKFKSILMLQVYTQVLCGIKTAFTFKKKLIMHFNLI